MQKKLLNKRYLKNQKHLLSTIGAIGDILAAEMAQGGSEHIESYVGRLVALLETVWTQRETNSEKFAYLFYSQEYLNCWEQNQEKAAFLMEFYPDRHLVLCAAILKQIFRLHNVADTNGNMEATYVAYSAMVRVLRLFSQGAKMEFYCKYTLGHIVSEVYSDFRKGRTPSTLISYRWFFSVVGEKDLRLGVLPIFGRHLLQTIRAVVRAGDTDLFRNFVSDACHSNVTHFIDGVSSHLHRIVMLVPHEIRQRENLYEERLLDRKTRRIFEIEQLEKWKNEFCAFIEKIKSKVCKNDKDTLSASCLEVCSALDEQFKYRYFLGLIYSACSFCLLRKRADLIHILWNYKQPADSDATWVGNDIYPRSIQSLCDIYFVQLRAGLDVELEEDHHGARLYVDQYFLLNALRIFSKTVSIGQHNVPVSGTSGVCAVKQETPKVNMADYPLWMLGSMTHYTSTLKKRLPDLFSDQSLDVLGLPLNEESVDFMMLFLDQLATTATKRLDQIHEKEGVSDARLHEFERDIVKSFAASLKIRPLIDLYGEVRNVEAREMDPKFGINQLDDKAAFFDEWHVHFGEWGSNYGEGLADGEDNHLLYQIKKCCKEISSNQLDNALAQINPNKAIIFSCYKYLYGGWLDKQEMYQAEWLYRQSEDARAELMELKGFSGVYRYAGFDIPVFETNADALDDTLLIIDSEKIGTLDIINPTEQDMAEFDIVDNLLIKVMAYSEKQEELGQLLESPPEWLREKGDLEAQRKYLKTLVAIRVFQKIDYHAGDAPVGFFIRMENGGLEIT